MLVPVFNRGGDCRLQMATRLQQKKCTSQSLDLLLEVPAKVENTANPRSRNANTRWFMGTTLARPKSHKLQSIRLNGANLLIVFDWTRHVLEKGSNVWVDSTGRRATNEFTLKPVAGCFTTYDCKKHCSPDSREVLWRPLLCQSQIVDLVGALSPVNHKGLHQDWTQTSLYI